MPSQICPLPSQMCSLLSKRLKKLTLLSPEDTLEVTGMLKLLESTRCESVSGFHMCRSMLLQVQFHALRHTRRATRRATCHRGAR